MGAELQDFERKNVIFFVVVVYVFTYALNLHACLQGG